jgi:hypothetical protein
MKVPLRILLAAAILCVLIFIGGLAYLGYDLSIDLIARYTHSADRIDRIKCFISPRTLRLIILFASVIAVILISIFSRFDAIYLLLQKGASLVYSSLILRFRNDWSGPLLYLMIIPVGASLYLAIRMPVSFDEAYTYVYFSLRGILSSISYYPAPNNHILHSVLTNICMWLPLPDVFCIRIPALIANIFCILFLFSFVKEYYNTFIAYATIAFFTTLLMTVYYAFMSRGYALECLCFILMTYSLFKILSQPKNKSYWIYFCISAILGFYTMPSFLYPFVIAGIFLVIMLRGISIYLCISYVAVGFITMMLYMPVIVTSGLGVLIKNEHVVPIKRSEVVYKMPGFIEKVCSQVTGIPFIIVLVFVVVAVLLMFLRYKGQVKNYYLLVLNISPVLLMLHSVIPFTRTFEYFTCIFSLCFGLVAYQILQPYAMTFYYFIALVFIQVLLLYNSCVQIINQEQYCILTHDILPQIDSGKNFSIYSYRFDLLLNQDLKEKNVSGYRVQCQHELDAKINMDTVPKGRADYYIVDTYADKTNAKKPFIKNEFYSIYRD